ncbi:MAG TPA: 3-methyl-2-oxobutanoate hydroxymethyltransferase [Porphyromonadaceae bacterium]|jgi:3-methyl-2-oxobutanoate hydroxymethyltransferase|uniref:3-methyl-2-oxobutanoate hydroxymethyltransferase n=1 Tax=Petrimonas sulfuriphila TaxID=285070 RepID=UPI000E9FE648|nr:3-methyl-2-oxobutanoate hydroxymethyltransferase [Petrimonas sp.]HBC37771.1 3-methyl-2-oxobutanoate hydroxymethyltransferase [Porphyromonadaceae bacterium]HBF96230.1 3-methyl-2-oxobutanoate hydroxymethyltransferase [Porphyromonadaceae bacterium]HCB88262.1 3-methyl-2-oxobutanoate hydroxymethyltransferase [Porphyromonadaceae bacterium]HOI79370.1 3-methyl-2-oxobutanoate hydroxymethyltransferase [Petrimonas sp.]
MAQKFTVKSFQEAKDNNRKISMLTAYDYSMAKIVDAAGIDSVLVGDSLGMVFQGNESTLPVTLDEIIYHTKAVVRGVKNALVVADMPFLSYHVSKEEAVRNAGRMIKEGGAEAVKMEGGTLFSETIKAVVDAQIPVMGHIGLTPQSVNAFGGFKVQGKDEQSAKRIWEDAKLLEEAGVFAITLECIPDKLAQLITKSLRIPTIGIGAGKSCDGQVLVINDMLGMFSDFVPRFIKQYAKLNTEITAAVQDYIAEVREGDFPAGEHTFDMDADILEKLY